MVHVENYLIYGLSTYELRLEGTWGGGVTGPPL